MNPLHERICPSLCNDRRHGSDSALLFEFLQLQFLGMDVDVPVVVQRQVPGFLRTVRSAVLEPGCCRARCATTRFWSRQCVNCLEITQLQFLDMFVDARRCATTGARVSTVLFLWRCRYCRSSTVVDIPVVAVQTALGGGAADAVYRLWSMSLVWHRGSMGKLCENCRRPQMPFLASFGGERIKQVTSSISLSDCCIAFTAVDIHTVEHVTKTTTTTTRTARLLH